jgi:hypothetical protein
LKRLEPCAVKVACTVLRGGNSSNAVPLPDKFAIANTSPDPAKALQRLLPSFAGCPKVFGKCFRLELDGEGHVLSVVEAEPVETRQAA